MDIRMQSDPEVLQYIVTVFPQELESLEQLAETLREQNAAGGASEPADGEPADIEPVLVTCMWMRRVLQQAQGGQLDVKGIFELSSCLANQMPKVYARRAAEIRAENQPGSHKK